MTEPSAPAPQTQHVTFHARVAGVGLITTMVVLVMACLTFMMQQWAVAGAQSTQIYQSLGHITAETVAPAVGSGDIKAAWAPLSALHGNKDVIAAELRDANGKKLASYARAGAAPKPQSTQL